MCHWLMVADTKVYSSSRIMEVLNVLSMDMVSTAGSRWMCADSSWQAKHHLGQPLKLCSS